MKPRTVAATGSAWRRPCPCKLDSVFRGQCDESYETKGNGIRKGSGTDTKTNISQQSRIATNKYFIPESTGICSNQTEPSLFSDSWVIVIFTISLDEHHGQRRVLARPLHIKLWLGSINYLPLFVALVFLLLSIIEINLSYLGFRLS
jgi:hypothetical protein